MIGSFGYDYALYQKTDGDEPAEDAVLVKIWGDGTFSLFQEDDEILFDSASIPELVTLLEKVKTHKQESA